VVRFGTHLLPPQITLTAALEILQRKYSRGLRRCTMHIDYELFHKSRRALFYLLAPKSLAYLTLAAHQEYRTNPSDPGWSSCLINQSAAGCMAKGCLRRTLLQGLPIGLSHAVIFIAAHPRVFFAVNIDLLLCNPAFSSDPRLPSLPGHGMQARDLSFLGSSLQDRCAHSSHPINPRSVTNTPPSFKSV
jgi:hypothetical protein